VFAAASFFSFVPAAHALIETMPSAAAMAAQAQAGGEGPSRSLKEALAKKISLDLRDMDIVDVLKFLSMKGDFNLAMDNRISGRVTLIMKSVSIIDALEVVLKTNRLAYQPIGDIVYVMTEEDYLSTFGKKFSDVTQVRIVNLRYAKPSYVLAALDSLKSNLGKIVIDEDSGSVVIVDTPQNLDLILRTIDQIDRARDSKVYQLQHAKAADIAAALKTRLDAKALGSVQADERSNQLLISGSQERINEVTRILKDLDKPTKAVLVEVRILQLILNPEYHYGINWSNPFGRSGSGTARDFNLSQAFPIATAVSGAGTLSAVSYGLTDPSLLQVQIQALEQVQDTRTIASPRLMVTNNEEAQIHIGDTIPYVTSTTTGTGDTATVSEEINFIDVGIKLNVTPTINEEGWVLLKIRPEISSQTATIETPQGASIPQINTTFVESTILVKDGYTVIIGGLKQLVNTDTDRGVPGLSKLPLLGKLFKSKSKTLEDTEIAIFLTPHIITGDKSNADQHQPIQPDKNYQGII
jgi:type II secretory pathway component GspD/PulD (secretin)